MSVSYYCSKCKMNHYPGSIAYVKHKQYAESSGGSGGGAKYGTLPTSLVNHEQLLFKNSIGKVICYGTDRRLLLRQRELNSLNVRAFGRGLESFVNYPAVITSDSEKERDEVRADLSRFNLRILGYKERGFEFQTIVDCLALSYDNIERITILTT